MNVKINLKIMKITQYQFKRIKFCFYLSTYRAKKDPAYVARGRPLIALSLFQPFWTSTPNH